MCIADTLVAIHKKTINRIETQRDGHPYICYYLIIVTKFHALHHIVIALSCSLIGIGCRLLLKTRKHPDRLVYHTTCKMSTALFPTLNHMPVLRLLHYPIHWSLKGK